MISVDDLIKWCIANAVGRSASFPKGWIRYEDLIALANKIKNSRPLAYEYSLRNNLPDIEEYGVDL